jgi:hypothetical protein
MIHAEDADNAVLMNDLSGRVIGCAVTVLNTLGVGFLKKVYRIRWQSNCGKPDS